MFVTESVKDMETNNNCSNNNSKKSDIAIKKSTQDL